MLVGKAVPMQICPPQIPHGYRTEYRRNFIRVFLPVAVMVNVKRCLPRPKVVNSANVYSTLS
jgi:hypothetical protein